MSLTPVRLSCMPFAGANRYSFGPLRRALAPDVAVESFDLPGRGARRREPLLVNLDALADDLLSSVLPTLANGPYAIFGHSLGAWLGLVLLRRIGARGLPLPSRLIVSGAPQPGCGIKHRQYDLPRDRFIDALRDMGGFTEELFASAEALDLFLPVIRADMQAMETYVAPPQPPVPIPIVALRGTADDVTRAEAEAWQLETTATFELKEFPGKHFFIFDELSSVADLLRSVLLPS